MILSVGRRAAIGLVMATGLVMGLPIAQPPARVAASELPAWRGGVSLYRDGTFSTQRSWLWCTAAGVQIVRNIVDRKTEHSASAQRRYFDWMRERNRYDLPESAGVDPEGWTAGLRHFVDDRYRLVASKTFDEAVRSAVTRLRLTSLPVALTVSHGNHGWILTGFRASADPATTTSFEVTSVRVTGPLYGLQSKDGYDMPPNSKLTTAELKRFFTPWRYAPKAMVWDGLYVSIQPVPTTAAAPATKPVPTAAPPGSPVIDADDVLDPGPATSAVEPIAAVAPVVVGGPSQSPVPVAEPALQPASNGPTAAIAGSILAFVVVGLAGAAVMVLRVLRRRPG